MLIPMKRCVSARREGLFCDWNMHVLVCLCFDSDASFDVEVVR